MRWVLLSSPSDPLPFTHSLSLSSSLKHTHAPFCLTIGLFAILWFYKSTHDRITEQIIKKKKKQYLCKTHHRFTTCFIHQRYVCHVCLFVCFYLFILFFILFSRPLQLLIFDIHLCMNGHRGLRFTPLLSIKSLLINTQYITRWNLGLFVSIYSIEMPVQHHLRHENRAREIKKKKKKKEK